MLPMSYSIRQLDRYHGANIAGISFVTRTRKSAWLQKAIHRFLDEDPRETIGKKQKQNKCQNIMKNTWNTKIALIAAASIVSLQGLNADHKGGKDSDRSGRGPKGKGGGVHLAKMDADENGSITKAEFMAAVASKGEDRVAKLFAQYDANEDSVITTDEITEVHAPAIEERLLGILARWDENEDGDLSAEELESAGNRGRGHRFSLDQFDANEDGVITNNELGDGGVAMLNERVNATLERYDSNEDGNITVDEVNAAQGVQADEHWAALLEKLDTDENGEISLEELEAGRPQRGEDARERRSGPSGRQSGPAVDNDDNEGEEPRQRGRRSSGGPRGPRRGR